MKTESSLSEKIRDYIKQRELAKLSDFDKKAEKEKDSNEGVYDLSDLQKRHQEERGKIEEKFMPVNWLTDAANRAKQINFVSHAIKYTHSDAQGSGVYAFKNKPITNKTGYLSSYALQKPLIDVVGNAAALDVAGLLLLEHDGQRVFDFLERGDASPFRPFVKTEEQLILLQEGFEQAFQDNKLSSHTLAKQLYFPMGENKYHLLAPLYASSFAQSIYDKISDSRFTEHSKIARNAKRNDQYCSENVVAFPNLAVQYFGGTKPQNISKLNTSRHGKSYLLSCAPPSWNKRIMRPPMKTKNIFYGEYNRLAWPTVKLLKKYLLSIVNKTSTDVRRDRRAEYIEDLIDILFHYAASVQGMRDYAGWSAESKLPKEQQLWLDPYRADEDFQQERSKNEWQEEISKQFALWVNKQLSQSNLKMGDAEFYEWSKLLSTRLGRLKEDIEVMA